MDLHPCPKKGRKNSWDFIYQWGSEGRIQILCTSNGKLGSIEKSQWRSWWCTILEWHFHMEHTSVDKKNPYLCMPWFCSFLSNFFFSSSLFLHFVAVVGGVGWLRNSMFLLVIFNYSVDCLLLWKRIIDLHHVFSFAIALMILMVSLLR